MTEHKISELSQDMDERELARTPSFWATLWLAILLIPIIILSSIGPKR